MLNKEGVSSTRQVGGKKKTLPALHSKTTIYTRYNPCGAAVCNYNVRLITHHSVVESLRDNTFPSIEPLHPPPPPLESNRITDKMNALSGL